MNANKQDAGGEVTNPDNVGGLLPCPFCGGAAERIDFGPGSGDNEGGSCIACTKCQASGPVEFGYKENFVSNWNRRELCRAAPAGVDMPPEDHRHEAVIDAELLGAGFLVDGKRVAPERVEMIRRSAPAGSGEVEDLATRLEREVRAWESWREEYPDEYPITTVELLRESAALLRKLQQGAE